MSLTIYVPSRGRFDERLSKGPCSQFPKGTDIVYVVGTDEVGKYALGFYENDVTARLLVCPYQPDIAKVREWCGHHAKASGLSKFVLMDDDVGLLVRKAEDTFQLRAVEPVDTRLMLIWMEKALDSFENVGISGREGNNRAGNSNMFDLVMYNTRLMRVQGFQTDAFLKCVHGRTRVMEDFDISLQILENGGQNICNYYWAQGQKMTNDTGGCSEWRTHAVHEESAKKLAELHPTVVSLRQKENKTDKDGFGTRTEVTVQWKSAAAIGQKLKGVSNGKEP